MNRTLLRALTLGVLALAPASQAIASATITIVNNNAAGVGFNDATPAVPVGGNSGTTVGQQRLNVFSQAAVIWGAILNSTVPIVVQAQFTSLTPCTATSGVLGSAGPLTANANFPGAEQPGYWYHAALANKMNGTDLSGATAEINANFNIDVDNATCLGTTNWYYGFDHNEGTNIDLLAVVLHELGHGLGFSTLTSSSTGALFNSLPSIWDRYLLDRTTGKHWDQMTNAERTASAINTNNLVWDGVAVTFKAPLVLAHPPRLVVPSGGAAGTYSANTASFGATLTTTGVTAPVVLVNDGVGTTSDGCDVPFTNAAAIAGKIALIDRGSCTFVAKAANAQAAGAVGVILVNNTTGALSPGGSDPTITIPVVGITQADGATLKANLSGLTATLGLDPNALAGADAQHRALMYSPNPVQPGSSVSHFDVSMTPNALMEPAINPDLTDSIDLARELFEDIGWFAHTTQVPPATPVALALAAGPNPNNGRVQLSFSLPHDAMVRLAAYDVNGRRVANLHQGRLAAGSHVIPWDAALAPGIYRVELTADGQKASRPVVRVN